MANAPYQYTFTVFTPTFNREHLLSRVYNSLLRQTYRDFEWLIVDDGSVDNTAEVVKIFSAGADFSIRYVWKANGGKHTAVNEGVRQAKGEFFAILDSDDWYVDDALEKMYDTWQSIEKESQTAFCGVCGLCCYPNGSPVGRRFPRDPLDSNAIEVVYVHRMTDDKKGCIRTDVMKEFPFPEDLGEFVTESVVWNRMARKYSTRFVNRIFAVVEYQEGGLTDSGRLHAVRSPKAMVLVLNELLCCGTRLPIAVVLKTMINLVRYSMHAHVSVRDLYGTVPNKAVLLLCWPVSIVLVLRDWLLLNKHTK